MPMREQRIASPLVKEVPVAARRQQRERRARILARAAEVGDDQAAAEAGVTVATLRRWRGESEPQPVSVPDPDSEQEAATPEVEQRPEPDPQAVKDAQKPRRLSDIDRMRQAANAAQIVAARAIRKTNEMFDAGRASDARNVAAAGGIWADKAAKWDQLIADAEDRLERQQAQLADEIAQQILDRMRRLIETLGVPLEHDAIRAVVRAALLDEEPAADVVARAREAAAEALAGPTVHGEVVDAEARELPALPAPAPPHPDGDDAERGERGELAAPVRKVRARRSFKVEIARDGAPLIRRTDQDEDQR